jgi:hypothetical protein
MFHGFDSCVPSSQPDGCFQAGKLVSPEKDPSSGGRACLDLHG